MQKWFSRDHCCWGRSKPGCQIVGSHTRWELTTWADFQLCLHWLLMSICCKSSHSGFLDINHSNGGLRIAGWIGKLSCFTIFFTSLSVAAFLHRAGGLKNAMKPVYRSTMAGFLTVCMHEGKRTSLWTSSKLKLAPFRATNSLPRIHTLLSYTRFTDDSDCVQRETVLGRFRTVYSHGRPWLLIAHGAWSSDTRSQQRPATKCDNLTTVQHLLIAKTYIHWDSRF